jgi:hypothetical protein
MKTTNGKLSRLIVVEIEAQRVIARIHEAEWEAARLYCLERWGVGVRLTTWRHASEEQKAAAMLLPVTKIAVVLAREYSAVLCTADYGGGR